MIKVDISTRPIFGSQKESTSYIADAASALEEVRMKKEAGTLKSEDFKTHWKNFKYVLWLKQHKKCCFCEQKINEQDSQVEHYRPRTEIKTEHGNILGYWWLAYEWLNFVVSCATCNRQKSTEFPLVVEGARVTQETPLGADGCLGHEQPRLINPRFDDPEVYFQYDVSQCSQIGEVYIKGKDSDPADPQRGNFTKRILGLNRERVNQKRDRDNLPGKRGKKYLEIVALWDDFVHYKVQIRKLRSVLPSMGDLAEGTQLKILQAEAEIAKLKEQIKTSMTADSEFAGLCRWIASMRPDATELHS